MDVMLGCSAIMTDVLRGLGPQSVRKVNNLNGRVRATQESTIGQTSSVVVEMSRVFGFDFDFVLCPRCKSLSDEM